MESAKDPVRFRDEGSDVLFPTVILVSVTIAKFTAEGYHPSQPVRVLEVDTQCIDQPFGKVCCPSKQEGANTSVRTEGWAVPVT